MNHYAKFFIGLFIVINSLIFGGCVGCPYSFTGASVPQHLKTLAIPFAEDRSGSGEATLKDNLTQQLIQKFIDDNNFTITDRNNADAILECVVLSLSDNPSALAGTDSGERLSTMRVTVTIKVSYRDMVEKKVIYDKTFTDYGEYPAGGSFQQRSEAIKTALDKITDDILLDTVSGW